MNIHVIGRDESTDNSDPVVSLDEGKESLSTSSFYQVSSTPEIQERVSALAAMMEATSLQRSFTSASIAQSLSADTSADRDANVGVDELSAHLQAKAQFNHGTVYVPVCFSLITAWSLLTVSFMQSLLCISAYLHCQSGLLSDCNAYVHCQSRLVTVIHMCVCIVSLSHGSLYVCLLYC